MTRLTFAGAVILAALPFTAAAQSADEETQPPTGAQGPMVVERVRSGFMFAPEVKVTEFDKKASGLVGGSAGWVADETFFIGGGGYWMATDRSRQRSLGYGGFVMQWFIANGDRFGLSAKALLGGGRATVPQTVTQIVGLPGARELDRLTPQQRNDLIRARTVTTTIGVREDVLVAEPEVNARFGLARHVRLTLGAGYRFAGNDWRRGGFDRGQRVSGAVGSLGVQIGG
jgi:hypothetical protein